MSNNIGRADDDDYEDDDGYDDEPSTTVAAPPAPPKKAPQPRAKPAATKPSSAAAKTKLQPIPERAVPPPNWDERAHAFAESLDDDGAGGQRGFHPVSRGVRPLDMRRGVDRDHLEVERLTNHGDDVEDDDKGWCGLVRDLQGFQDEIAKKWGGGQYRVRGVYDGRPREDIVEIAGSSKSVAKDDDDDYRDNPPITSARTFAPPFGGQPPFGGMQPSPPGFPRPGGWPGGQQQGPYGAPPPWPPHNGFGQPPVGFGQPPAGYYPPPHGPYGMQYGQTPFPVSDPKAEAKIAELERLVKEQAAATQAAREEAAKEREERRVERERADAEKRDMKAKADLELMRAEMAQLRASLAEGPKKGGADSQFDKMMALQMAKIDAEQVKLEKERADREDRYRQDQTAAQARAEAEAKNQLETRKIDQEQERNERERQDKFLKLMMESMSANKLDPLALIERLNGLTAKKGGAMSEVKELVSLVAVMKEAFGSDGGGEANQIKDIIEASGEALTGAVTAFRSGGGQAGPPVDPAHLLAAQRAAAQQALPMLPGSGAQMSPQQAYALQQQQHMYRMRQAQQFQAMQQQPQGPQAAVAVAQRDPTAEEWGQILNHILAAYGEDKEPDQAVQELHAFVVNQLGVPKALERMSGATPALIRWAASDAKGKLPVGSPLIERVDLFLQLLDDDDGRDWVEDFINDLREYQASIREAALQAQQAQQVARAAAQAAQGSQPSQPPMVPQAHNPGPPPAYPQAAPPPNFVYHPQFGWVPRPPMPQAPVDPRIAAVDHQQRQHAWEQANAAWQQSQTTGAPVTTTAVHVPPATAPVPAEQQAPG